MERLPMQSVAMDFQQFLTSQNSAVLATLDTNQLPNASYAPYLWHDGKLYIYVSELAKHTGNLFVRPGLSVMVIEDEKTCQNIFARKRATLMATAKPIDRQHPNWADLMHHYVSHHGETALHLQNLKDFHLFELEVLSATFVRGFAQAYTLNGDALNEVKHMNDRGHGQSSRHLTDAQAS
ncbi:pyridoxamine 5'-phosphate oxidase [Thiomicrospira aerophila AL3]|uniref:Pyridoxamine 5'-phosphate oxidase n=1 Tax=Thiomicrospira aerophila AL3 TaxID=717772 RepID=W0DY04_9GAMM|nr:pyridoxamine 5'-phosphate oxidase family protein [Thiomicrospira aerophila]AHF01731.1 pyridoxamine 5'-phosphate oxidase [Thiomicrospira aerophila AL3]